jgi:hypothetical protein
MGPLGEDLVLLAISPRSGRLASADRLRFGLMGAELVRLAADRRVDITGDRIVVLDAAPTGDPELDAALSSLVQAGRPPRPRKWVGAPRRHICDSYLARLANAGAIQADRGGLLPVTRWRITDEARAAAVRARLDAIAGGSGPVDTEQAALAGLASASGLGSNLYPGWGNRGLRKRLDQVAKGQVPKLPATGAAAEAAGAAGLSADAGAAAAHAAAQAAADAAMQAATQAATDAAVAAAVHAAHHAAVAHSAAVHGGGGHG